MHPLAAPQRGNDPAREGEADAWENRVRHVLCGFEAPRQGP